MIAQKMVLLCGMMLCTTAATHGQLKESIEGLTKALGTVQEALTRQQKPSGPTVTPTVTRIDDNQYTIGKINLYIVQADITKLLDANAIVNAANQTLPEDPGGVAGAIWNAAGKDKINEYIRTHIKKNNPKYILDVGQAIWTPSFDIGSGSSTKYIAKYIQYIIHTPGPDCRANQSVGLLTSCYKNSLTLADGLEGCKSIAFPAISIGIFGCPIGACAKFAIEGILIAAPSLKQIRDIYLIINPDKTDQKAQQYKEALIQELQKRAQK